jgi:hypothetical protein
MEIPYVMLPNEYELLGNMNGNIGEHELSWLGTHEGI